MSTSGSRDSKRRAVRLDVSKALAMIALLGWLELDCFMKIGHYWVSHILQYGVRCKKVTRDLREEVRLERETAEKFLRGRWPAFCSVGSSRN